MRETKQVRVLAAALGGSNFGLGLPSTDTINLFLNWHNWSRSEELDSIIVRMWSGCMEDPEVEEFIIEECRSWLPKLLEMDESKVKTTWPTASALVGLDLGPMEIQLRERMEVRELMLNASYHYADDSAKEWPSARALKREAAKIMVKNRWTAQNMMKIHEWVRPIYPVEDTMNEAVKIMYEALDLIKNIMEEEKG